MLNSICIVLCNDLTKKKKFTVEGNPRYIRKNTILTPYSRLFVGIPAYCVLNLNINRNYIYRSACQRIILVLKVKMSKRGDWQRGVFLGENYLLQ